MLFSRVRRFVAWTATSCWLGLATWFYAAPYTATPMSGQAKAALRGAQNLGCSFGAQGVCAASNLCTSPGGNYGCIGGCSNGEMVCGVNPDGTKGQNVPTRFTGLQTDCKDCSKQGCTTSCLESDEAVGACVDYASCTCVTMKGYNNGNPYCADTGTANDDYEPACFVLP